MMLARRAGLPHDLEPDLTPCPPLVENDFAHNKAQNALAVGRRRGGGIPNPRQVLAQGLQLRASCRADDERLFGAPARVFLIDGFNGAQLLFPSTLKRARHQSVLGLDCVILASRSLGLVTNALAAERPLPLDLPALFLQLPYRGKRNRNLIGSESINHDALNERIDRQGSNFLTQHIAPLISIGSAAVNWIVAIWP